MAGRLVNALGSSALAAEAFSDLATLRHMLRFEAALAQAAAEAGLIPKKFAPIIVKACDPALYDPASLAEAARRTATLTVPVVKALADEVAKRDADAAGYVHWGATSQDVIDTAMVLQLGEALPPIVACGIASFAASRVASHTLCSAAPRSRHAAGARPAIAGWAPTSPCARLERASGKSGRAVRRRLGQPVGAGRGRAGDGGRLSAWLDLPPAPVHPACA
jgi:3-carboxy-cis,cis-muconate cycloisomerase